MLQNTVDPRDSSRSIYAWHNGTSMAAPHVSGVAALLFAAGAKTPAEVEAALIAGSRPGPEGSGWTQGYGHGLLHAAGALQAFREGTDANWKPFLWALALLAVVLLTLRRRERPGFLNALLRPGFLLMLVLSCVGAFFLRWVPGSGSASVWEAAALPLPDLDRIIFGRGKLAHPLVYSALLPFLGAVVAVRWKAARPVVAGLSLGFAAFLAYAAFARAPGLAYLPFSFLAVPYLVLNALVCLVISRALLRRGEPR